VSAGTSGAPRADPQALEAVAAYKAARERGEHRLLMLPGADLRDTDMSGLNLDECDFSGAALDGAQFVGTSLVRSCLAGASLVGVDCSYADLRRADLHVADATAATFVSATLQKTNLTRCRLQRADLSDADLTRANLYESDLTGADMRRALAEQADLRGAILEDAVLTGLRGEPLFDIGESRRSPDELFGWPASRLAQPQLVELAQSYLSTHGWGIIELSSSREEGIDLMARRGNELIVVQAKATATPSPQIFLHLAKRLRRAASERPNVYLILVMPGPVPQSLQDLAQANQIGVLSVRVDENSMRVEEVVRPAGDSLVASA
jgi:uncharacterized protein YjbI with pentapeptide repeats